MSEINDGIAVVEFFGRLFVFAGHFAEGTIRFNIALFEWQKNKPLRKGEQKFSKLAKKCDGDFSVLKFGDMDEEVLAKICERFKEYGVAYAEAPLFGAASGQKAIAVQNKDINIVKTLLESIEYDWLSPASYLKSQDPEAVEKAVNSAKTYEDLRETYESMSGNISEQLNHKDNWTGAHKEPWYLVDLDHPKNYIQMTSRKVMDGDKEVVRTTYITYRDSQQISTYEDRHGFSKWKKAREQMAADIGVSPDYGKLVTIRGMEAGGYLKKYQELFEAEKSAPKEKNPAPEVTIETESVQFIPAALVKKPDEKSQFCVIETKDGYVKIPKSFVMDTVSEGNVKVKMPKELPLCDRTGNELVGTDGMLKKTGMDKVLEDVAYLTEILGLKAFKSEKKL